MTAAITPLTRGTYISEHEHIMRLREPHFGNVVAWARRQNRRCVWTICVADSAAKYGNRKVATVRGEQPEAAQRALVKAILGALS